MSRSIELGTRLEYEISVFSPHIFQRSKRHRSDVYAARALLGESIPLVPQFKSPRDKGAEAFHSGSSSAALRIIYFFLHCYKNWFLIVFFRFLFIEGRDPVSSASLRLDKLRLQFITMFRCCFYCCFENFSFVNILFILIKLYLGKLPILSLLF